MLAACSRFILLLVLLVGAGVGMCRLHAFVMAQPQYAANTAHVVLADRPAWMSEAWAAEIRAELSLALGPTADTFDPDLARRVHAAAAACPWVRRVREVRVERVAASESDATFSRGRVVVDASYRQPVAVGVAGPRERYVDVEGVILPYDQARRHTAGWHVVRIVGVSRPSGINGEVWAADDLAAGLWVLRLLWHKPYFTEIQTIDVSNFGRRHDRAEPSIRLLALSDDRLTEIRFGDLPSDDLPLVGAPSVRRRLGYLDGWYTRNGGRLAGPRYLDLRFPDQIGYPSSYQSPR